MYVILWEYQVKPEKQSEFERLYASDGAWAELFKKGTGYLGTELLRAENQSNRCLTLDRWASKKEYEHFLAEWETDYKALDARCEDLTETERLAGGWHS
jgi:heme-degrading monooxygenase HmoA